MQTWEGSTPLSADGVTPPPPGCELTHKLKILPPPPSHAGGKKPFPPFPASIHCYSLYWLFPLPDHPLSPPPRPILTVDVLSVDDELDVGFRIPVGRAHEDDLVSLRHPPAARGRS